MFFVEYSTYFQIVDDDVRSAAEKAKAGPCCVYEHVAARTSGAVVTWRIR